MAESPEKQAKDRSKFPRLYWLVVIFEFFERGSYYGMMSVLSVYLTDQLDIPKENVGIIKGTIQPLLYFLPIITGALADRFGYRRTLMVAFSLLGGGYFLTSQATDYAAVFMALVVMGIGAGTFKPVISGTIARCTDETNSTLGFGIFYWTINLGAFLFPLFLVPFLKNNVGWDWVIIAAALGTGAMLIPTLLFFKEPPKGDEEEEGAEEEKPGLLQTLANAFEIIYSPFVLLFEMIVRGPLGKGLFLVLLVGLLGFGGYQYWTPQPRSIILTQTLQEVSGKQFVVRVKRNLCKSEVAKWEDGEEGKRPVLMVYRPGDVPQVSVELAATLAEHGYPVAPEVLVGWVKESAVVNILDVVVVGLTSPPIRLDEVNPETHRWRMEFVDPGTFTGYEGEALEMLAGANRHLASLEAEDLTGRLDDSAAKPFLVLFVALLMVAALLIRKLNPKFLAAPTRGARGVWLFVTLAVLEGIVWLVPDLSLFSRILTGVIAVTLLSLYAIDFREVKRFHDHFRFLVMIFIYAGFWVLYFQMFDSVLWYVQGYVDAASLNDAVNGLFSSIGVGLDWRFDVEHVTVINAGTIILLQLFISNIVKDTRALPTMIVGISMGTIGMAILAISTSIWVFIAGTIIFSVGEMTAHPKFISYVGQTAPRSRVAMYMGYLFLYGVIGSSIGGVLGANLYVKYVDEMNEPQTLWLIFTGIGVATIVGLLLFNRFAAQKK